MSRTLSVAVALCALCLISALSPRSGAAAEWRVYSLEPGKDGALSTFQDAPPPAALPTAPSAPPLDGPGASFPPPLDQTEAFPAPDPFPYSDKSERETRLEYIQKTTNLDPASPEALPTLLGLVDKVAPTETSFAIRALAELIHSPQQLEQALPVLLLAGADLDPEMRLAALTVVTESFKKFPQAAQLLLARLPLLESGPKEQAQGLVALLSALGSAAEPATPALNKLLAAPEERTRFYAAMTLFSIKGAPSQEALPVILQAAASPSLGEQERVVATMILGAFYDPATKQTILPVLLRNAREESPSLRYAAIFALGQAAQDGKNNPPELTPTLLMYFNEQDPQLAFASILAMGLAGPETPGIEAAFPVLEKLLGVPSTEPSMVELKQGAAWALTKISPERAARMSPEQKAWVTDIEAKLARKSPCPTP